MFRMTMTASQAGIIVQQCAVHRCDIPHLFSNARMAVRAAIRHDGRIPGRSVAGCTVAPDLRMRGDAAEHPSALRVQWARVIDQTATRVSVAGDDERCDQRGDQSRPR